MKIENAIGYLSDHYNPTEKKIALSYGVYDGNSISAVAVAAHESGHALQDKNNYAFLRIRNAIIPTLNIISYAGYIAVLVGIFTTITKLVWIGTIAESAIIVFQLLTLPVEFNASKTALKEIEKYNILNIEEMKYAKKVLKAAAFTYVAGLAASILELLRLLSFMSDGKDRE